MVKTRLTKIIGWVGSLALLLTACSGPGVIGFDLDYQASNSDHQYTSSSEHPSSRSSELKEIQVEDVRVEIGVGSPVPVKVLVSGTWPGLCSQLAEIKETSEEKTFEIQLLATPDGADCPPDRLGLPFGIEIPLNMVEKKAGTYTVSVNGKETRFDWGVSASE